MPAPSPALSASIDNAPIDVLKCALAMMLKDGNYEAASLFVEEYPALKLARPLASSRLEAPANLDGRALPVETTDDRMVRQLEQRLAQIRHDVACHAIGAPFTTSTEVASTEVAAEERE